MGNLKWAIIILAYLPMACTVAGEGEQLSRLSADEFEQALLQQGNAILLDVRTPGEYGSGHIEGAVLLNFYDRHFSEEIKKLPKQQEIYIYCQSSNRSMQAVKMLQQEGFEKIVELRGGMGAWYASGKKVKT